MKLVKEVQEPKPRDAFFTGRDLLTAAFIGTLGGMSFLVTLALWSF